MSRRIAYWVATKKHPSFENDFHWDNVDEVIDKTFLMDKIPSPTDYVLQHKPNFITYGSFFGTSDDVDQQMVKSLALTGPLPSEKHGLCSLKATVFNVVNQSIGRIGKIVAQVQPQSKLSVEATAKIEESHVLLAAANQAIEDATIPEPKQASDVPMSTISMMPFNDGISPISSSLWLGRFSAQAGEKDPSKRLWGALRFLKGKDQARLFPGMDHRNWIENQTRMVSNQVPDLLNPQHSSKSVFDWLIYDLMSHQD
jgi:GH24 family phage-related lysozyme (muramidase)